jgi:hypothetical protein
MRASVGKDSREKEHGAQRTRLADHRAVGTLAIAPHLGTEKSNDQAEDHRERRQHHRRHGLERGRPAACSE